MKHIFSFISMLVFSFISYSQTIISGNVSGVWTLSGSPYIVVEDITLNEDLTIEPGVRVQFQAGGWSFAINGGKLIARGTITDSIYFEPIQGETAGLWQGIVADNNSGSDTLEYCVIRYAVRGMEVKASANNPRPPVVMKRSEIYGSFDIGALSHVYTGAATAAVAQLFMYDCKIHHNSSHGVWLNDTVVGSGNAVAELVRCQIYNNGGAGLYQRNNTHAYIYNCTITGNASDGLNSSSDTKVTNSIVAYNGGYGINDENNHPAFEPEDIIYNNVWGNQVGRYNNFSAPNFGYPATINANGDSCDFNFNIYLDPVFVDSAYNDFNLDRLSPAIDAGTTIVGGEIIFDPDSTVPDMGALFYNQNPTEIFFYTNTVLRNFILSQNYTNPFNPATRIKYSIGSEQGVLLKIYDLLGKEIATLVNEEKLPGAYTVEFNASKLTSGIYLYQLQAGGFSQTKKMILMR